MLVSLVGVFLIVVFFSVAAFTILGLSLGIFSNFMRGTPITWELTRSLLREVTTLLVPLFWLFVELASGSLLWQMWEKLYADTIAHQRKFDAPPVRLEIDKPYVC